MAYKVVQSFEPTFYHKTLEKSINRHVTMLQEHTTVEKAFTLQNKAQLQIRIPGFGN